MPFKNMNELMDSINKQIIKSIHSYGRRVYDTSQNTEACYVPVDKGKLKMSGSISRKEDSVEISYGSESVDYASKVELGALPEPIIGDFEEYVPSYIRKDGTKVEGYFRTYHNSKPICFRPKIDKFTREERICRVMKMIPGQKGQFYLTRGVQDTISEFPAILENNLKELEKM